MARTERLAGTFGYGVDGRGEVKEGWARNENALPVCVMRCEVCGMDAREIGWHQGRPEVVKKARVGWGQVIVFPRFGRWRRDEKGERLGKEGFRQAVASFDTNFGVAGDFGVGGKQRRGDRQLPGGHQRPKHMP